MMVALAVRRWRVLQNRKRTTDSLFVHDRRKIVSMTFGSSVIVLAIVLAAIGLLALACFAPRRKSLPRRKQKSLDPLSEPTITHYGHA
jgi:hypothetical protein